MSVPAYVDCGTCEGSGELLGDTCPACEGRTVIPVDDEQDDDERDIGGEG